MNIRQRFFFLGMCGAAVVFASPASFSASASSMEKVKLVAEAPVVRSAEVEKPKMEETPQILPETAEAAKEKKTEATSPPSSEKVQVSGMMPGWRPVPNPESFPKNPFSGVLSTATPTAFKAEFDELAQQISGIMQIGMETAVIIQNRVVRQGERIMLRRESEKLKTTMSERAELENELGDEPTVIFKGIDREKEIAKFALGETDIHLPIPSARRKIKAAQGNVFMMDRIGTATFLNNNGYFVAAASYFANMGEKDEVRVKTQFGTFSAEIVKKDASSNLALGRTKVAINIEDIPWNAQHVEKGQEGVGEILAFDPQVFDFRPKVIKINSAQANPPWMVGCPMILNHEVVGVLAQKDKKLIILNREELNQMFPEASAPLPVEIEVKKEGQEEKEESKPVEKVSWLEPRESLGKDAEFFNPEKVVGLIQIRRIK